MIKCNSSKAGNNADGISWRIDIGKRDQKKKKKEKGKTPGNENICFFMSCIFEKQNESRRGNWGQAEELKINPKLSVENHLLGARTGKDSQTVQ